MDKNSGGIITKIEEFVLSYSIILMAVILVGSVISRTLFNSSWTFAEEVGQSLVIIVTFMGIGYGARKAKHISMSAIFDLVSEKHQKIIILIVSGLTSVGMFYLSYIGLRYTLMVKQFGRFTPALQIPMYLILMVVPIGFFLGAIEYAKTFFINLKEKDVYVSSEKRTADMDSDLLNEESNHSVGCCGYSKEREGQL